MARSFANNGRVYRAVITTRFLDGSRESTEILGPYDKPSTAQALITRAENNARNSKNRYRDPAYAYDAVGHIEWAPVTWLPLEYVYDGATYRTDAVYVDSDGDTWEFTGHVDYDGDPQVTCEAVGDMWLSTVIQDYGPLTQKKEI